MTVRPMEGYDILHFYASGGRLNLSPCIIGGDDLGLHVIIVPKQHHLLWEPLLCQCAEFALYSVNFVLAGPSFSFFTLMKGGLFGVGFFLIHSVKHTVKGA